MKIIRRIAALLVLLVTLCTCAMAEGEIRGYDKKDGYVYLTLGMYPQGADGSEAPILWRVLSVEDSAAYILSEYVLLAHRIHGDYTEYANKETNKKKPGFNGDFARTELSAYLNGEFADFFTEGERALIIADESLGLFYPPTADDLKDKALGFGTNQSRKAWATEYAVESGLFVYGSKYGKHSPYWTRTQSTSDARHARCTKDEGEIGRINVITEDLGMRPACVLDLTRAVILSGAGTVEDPYVLDTAPAADTPAEAPAADETNDCNCVPEGETCDCCDCCSCSRR